jgi:hypothetical protein
MSTGSNVQIEKGVGAFLASIKTWAAIISLAVYAVLAVLVIAGSALVTSATIALAFGLIYAYHVSIRNSHYRTVMLPVYGLSVLMAFAAYSWTGFLTVLFFGIVGEAYRRFLKRSDDTPQA